MISAVAALKVRAMPASCISRPIVWGWVLPLTTLPQSAIRVPSRVKAEPPENVIPLNWVSSAKSLELMTLVGRVSPNFRISEGLGAVPPQFQRVLPMGIGRIAAARPCGGNGGAADPKHACRNARGRQNGSAAEDRDRTAAGDVAQGGRAAKNFERSAVGNADCRGIGQIAAVQRERSFADGGAAAIGVRFF